VETSAGPLESTHALPVADELPPEAAA